MYKCKECSKKQYCQKCGAEMTLHKNIYQYFDSNTGKRVDYHTHEWICPKLPKIIGIIAGHSFYDDTVQGEF